MPFDAHPPDVVRAAALKLQDGLLASIVARPRCGPVPAADRLAADTQVAAVGAASIYLVRALIASTTGESAGAVHHETLLACIHGYIPQHLRDPALGSDQIAAVHAMSRRQLFALSARWRNSLVQVIITRRLETAYGELGLPGARHETIAAVAAKRCFRDPAHFSRRFRDAFGLTKGERRAAATPRP